MEKSEAAHNGNGGGGGGGDSPERHYARTLEPRRTPSFDTPPFAPPYSTPSRTSSLSSLSSTTLGRFSKLPLIPRKTAATAAGDQSQSAKSPLRNMGALHTRHDSASTQNTTDTMADIDGYSQSQRDFYTVNPHLYAQQPAKSSSKGPQQFHLNATDANGRGTATNGSVTPVNQARPSKAEIIFDMTPHEIALTQQLWNELMTDPEALEKSAAYGTPTALFCEQFYTNLMAAHAEISSIFPSIKKQSIAVAGVFGLAIKSLNRIEELDPFLWAVGKRHNRMIGVEPIHYRWLGEAMVKTFADRFGEQFTLEVETAWIKIYSYLANKLLAADEEPNVLLFAPQKRFQQNQQQSMLSSSPQGHAPGISPTSSYNMGGYQTTQDVRKPSISSSVNSHSINTSVSNNSTAPTSMVNSVNNNHNNHNNNSNSASVPVTPNNNNNNAAAAAAMSARRNVSAAPSVPSSLPSAPAPAPMATDSSATKNLRMKAGRKHGRKGKDDEKCVIA